MARNVENLAGGIRAQGPRTDLTVKRFDPEPDTDAEDNAVFDGLQQGMSQQTGNPIYFGTFGGSASTGRKPFPFIPNRPESLLEYDISRAILRAHDGANDKIRILTSMQIGGGFSGNMQAPMTPPWFLVQDLKRDYDVEFLPATVTEIPGDTDVLILLHPHDVGDEAQFAIDQYLLKGGRVIAAVDPNFFASRFMSPQPGNPMMGQQGGGGPPPSSNLDKLFDAWGVKYVDNKVLADTVFQTQIATGYSPTILSLPQEAMNGEDPVTMQLSDVFLVMPGAFEIGERTQSSLRIGEYIRRRCGSISLRRCCECAVAIYNLSNPEIRTQKQSCVHYGNDNRSRLDCRHDNQHLASGTRQPKSKPCLGFRKTRRGSTS